MDATVAETAALRGLMQPWPLTLNRFLEHAARWHAHREVWSYGPEGGSSRHYSEILERARRISAGLSAHGIRAEDRVATMATNNLNHLEVWYGIVGMGAVCHTLNPRLFSGQLTYIVNHAADRLIFADAAFADLLAEILPSCPGVEQVVFFSEPPASVALPVRWTILESWLEGHGPGAVWGQFDEESPAGLCYTSGTTGDPKGVVYTHRSNFLHTLFALQPDVVGLSSNDCVMPLVPMFHANAWGLVYMAPAVGARMVLPGANMDGVSLWQAIERHGVTVAFGVPTIWQSLLQYMREAGVRPRTLKQAIVGGSPCPERVARELAELGVETLTAWGMTELSPFGTFTRMLPETADLSSEEQLKWRLKQGRPHVGVDVKIVDGEGDELDRDGVAMGALRVKGPAVAAAYYRGGSALDEAGYLETGDIATIDSLGFVEITDRAKDVIKSGGEWISSTGLESLASMHPAAAQTCAIGAPHPKWDERPVLYVKLRPGFAAEPEDFRQFLRGRVAKWWIPEEVIFINDLPVGSTGKPDKNRLREMYLQRSAAG